MRTTRLLRLAAITIGLASAISMGACGGTPDNPRWSISGTVSGAVQSGVTVNLAGAATSATATNSSGVYSFSGLADGSYTVTPSLAGYTFNPANRSVTLSGADVVGQDFTATALPHVISGTVSGAVSQGVTMSLTGASNATTATDTAGHYSFAGLANGAYTVTPSLAGYTFNPANRSVTLSGADVGGQDFIAAQPMPGIFAATGGLRAPREAHTATLLASGKVLVAGGLSGTHSSTPANSCGTVYQRSAEVYDPAAGTFTVTGSMAIARHGHTATLL